MTLVLFWRDNANIVVIADTLFRANGQNALEVGPKIFAVPVRLKAFSSNAPAFICPDMGFAFAGHTAAGQVTHAIASASLANLAGREEAAPPTVADVAHFYGRCAAYVVGEMLRNHESVRFLFEGIIFGWEGDAAIAYSFEVKIEHGRSFSTVEHVDFAKHGLYAIGQGDEKIQAFIYQSCANGIKASPYDALEHRAINLQRIRLL